MIKLKLEDYCQDCHYLSPVVLESPSMYVGAKIISIGDTEIICKHSEMCAKLRKKWEEENKEE